MNESNDAYNRFLSIEEALKQMENKVLVREDFYWETIQAACVLT